MARPRSNNRRRRVSYSQPRRAASASARPRGLLGLSFRYQPVYRPSMGYLDPGQIPDYISKRHHLVEDNRQWSPATLSPSSRTTAGAPARLAASTSVPRTKPPSLYHPSPLVTFHRPRSVIVCIRRSIRRQVLHAFSIAGKSGLRPPRRNATSNISCRG